MSVKCHYCIFSNKILQFIYNPFEAQNLSCYNILISKMKETCNNNETLHDDFKKKRAEMLNQTI